MSISTTTSSPSASMSSSSTSSSYQNTPSSLLRVNGGLMVLFGAISSSASSSSSSPRFDGGNSSSTSSVNPSMALAQSFLIKHLSDDELNSSCSVVLLSGVPRSVYLSRFPSTLHKNIRIDDIAAIDAAPEIISAIEERVVNIIPTPTTSNSQNTPSATSLTSHGSAAISLKSHVVLIDNLSDFVLEFGWMHAYKLIDRLKVSIISSAVKTTVIVMVNATLHSPVHLTRLQNHLVDIALNHTPINSSNSNSNSNSNSSSSSSNSSSSSSSSNGFSTIPTSIIIASDSLLTSGIDSSIVALTTHIIQYSGKGKKIVDRIDFWRLVSTSFRDSHSSSTSSSSTLNLLVPISTDSSSKISGNGNNSSSNSNNSESNSSNDNGNNNTVFKGPSNKLILTIDSNDPDIEDESLDDDLDL